jgi:hypothetical protein
MDALMVRLRSPQVDKNKELHMRRSSVYMGVVLMMFMSMGAGCASTRQTTTTETTVKHTDSSHAVPASEPTAVVEKNTTTTTETEQGHTGLVGGIFHVIGSVIALPFILIGGLLRMIF